MHLFNLLLSNLKYSSFVKPPLTSQQTHYQIFSRSKNPFSHRGLYDQALSRCYYYTQIDPLNGVKYLAFLLLYFSTIGFLQNFVDIPQSIFFVIVSFFGFIIFAYLVIKRLGARGWTIYAWNGVTNNYEICNRIERPNLTEYDFCGLDGTLLYKLTLKAAFFGGTVDRALYSLEDFYSGDNLLEIRAVDNSTQKIIYGLENNKINFQFDYTDFVTYLTNSEWAGFNYKVPQQVLLTNGEKGFVTSMTVYDENRTKLAFFVSITILNRFQGFLRRASPPGM